MASEDIQSWSKTAADNGTADAGIDWHEHQQRKSVNNSARSMMAAHAKQRDLLNGSIVTTGTANAQAFLSGVTYTAMPSRLLVKLQVGPGLTNSGPVTLNMDGLGDKQVKTLQNINLSGAEFIEGRYVDLVWDGTFWRWLGYGDVFVSGAPFGGTVATWVSSTHIQGSSQISNIDLLNCTANTPTPGDADTSIATTAYVQEAIFGGQGIVLAVQVFSTPGAFTYTPHGGMKSCIIECVGGGGGGGSSACSPGNLMGGGGGGSGGYSRKFATASQIGVSQGVVVGAGGAAGGYLGGTGGNTAIGVLCIANGGGGGGGTVNGDRVPVGGLGGAPGVGDITAAGSPGEQGEYSIGLGGAIIGGGGRGGSSYFGGGAQIAGVGGTGSGLGANGGNYGAGGSGAITHQTSGFIAAGNGSGGIVIITEFSGVGLKGDTGATGPQGPQGIPGPPGGLGEAPTDGQLYGRQSSAWAVVPGATANFTTGDAKLTLKTTADAGWVMMNDGTIGSATSGASARANADCQALFTLLYNNISDVNAPVLTSAGVATNRATQGTAAAAWAANVRMTLTRQLGRALGIAGAGSGLTSRALGGFLGEEGHSLTVGELAAHNHPAFGASQFAYYYSVGGVTITYGGGEPNTATLLNFNAVATATGVNVSTSNTGSGDAHNTMQPTAFWNIMIKL